MTLLHAILLGLVQGLTEFLPVSSTAHLTLVENLLLKQSMPLAYDVLLHVGTLAALAVYFRKDLAKMVRGIFGGDPEGQRMVLLLIIAMVPTGVFALLTRHWKELAKGHLWLYGVFLLVTAGMLFVANTTAKRRNGRDLSQINGWDALAVGAIQGLGGGFGLSRSGSTICVGVFRGLQLPASARFSFLLGMPTIALAALYEGKKVVMPLLRHQPLPPELAFPAGSISPTLACAVGVVVAGLSGYAAIGLLDRFTRQPRLHGFAAYCVLAGLAVLVLGLRG
ncbi:undecaprenyl-diphosphate phosphatase [Holophaga foetida]|uniref:undecaprenyl-diphosphate phosphatase n=1 Tax=Holophaga foetida TaxID=35839 RepID=UPI0002472A65|nr:undecaprenyl-diphosphate phosphatase [Holophaga foetida]